MVWNAHCKCVATVPDSFTLTDITGIYVQLTWIFRRANHRLTTYNSPADSRWTRLSSSSASAMSSLPMVVGNDFIFFRDVRVCFLGTTSSSTACNKDK